jgi:hypothetical protein
MRLKCFGISLWFGVEWKDGEDQEHYKVLYICSTNILDTKKVSLLPGEAGLWDSTHSGKF